MESKQLLLIEKCICLRIISVNSVCKFSEIYLLYSLTVTTNSHFSKMALVGFNSFMTGFYMITASVMKEFKNEPVSLDVNKVCFEEEQDIPITREKSRKSQSITELCRCWQWGTMYTNVEYLSCGEVEALGYIQLLGMRLSDMRLL